MFAGITNLFGSNPARLISSEAFSGEMAYCLKGVFESDVSCAPSLEMVCLLLHFKIRFKRVDLFPTWQQKLLLRQNVN